MNTLYDSLQTTQGVTFLDDVMFTGQVFISQLFNASLLNVPILTALTPPAGFVNPVISTNQGVGAPQLYLFLRLLDVTLISEPFNGNFPLHLGLPRQYALSQFFTSANVPASATGNVQTFQFAGASSEYTGKMIADILTRTQFQANSNINVTKVEVGDDGVNFDNVNAPPGVLSSAVSTDYTQFYGQPGFFHPTVAPTGIYIRVTVNNTAASVQTYSFIAFGSCDINDIIALSLQYQDIQGSFHQMAYLDNKITTQNVPLNMLIQAPVLASTADYGKLAIIPRFLYSPMNATAIVLYTLTATFAYMQTGVV